MTALLPDFLALVERHGEWMLFVLAVAETCFITGLVVPSGLATSVATALAADGHLSPLLVAAAAVGGGWVGDSIGFWVGRRGGEWLASGEGRTARRYRRRVDEAERIFGRHPLVSVTFARLVSFVRTVMPMAAGMSHIPYPRFLVYEGLGVAGWAALYMGVGYLVGEGFDQATRVLGLGGAAAFAVAVVVLVRLARRRRARRRRSEGAPC